MVFYPPAEIQAGSCTGNFPLPGEKAPSLDQLVKLFVDKNEEMVEACLGSVSLEESDSDGHDLLNIASILGKPGHFEFVLSRYAGKYSEIEFSRYLNERRELIVESMPAIRRKECITALFDKIVGCGMDSGLLYAFASVLGGKGLIHDLAMFDCTVSYLNKEQKSLFYRYFVPTILAQFLFNKNPKKEIQALIHAGMVRKIEILPPRPLRLGPSPAA